MGTNIDTRAVKERTNQVRSAKSSLGPLRPLVAPAVALLLVVAFACERLPEPPPDDISEGDVVEEPRVVESPKQRGLHYTAEELAVWRERSLGGPYKSRGDVSTNSPGDWSRIVENKNAFLRAPSNGRWRPEWGSGPIPLTRSSRELVPKSTYPLRVRDAAFYALVKQDEFVAREAIKELLGQAREPRADMGDQSRFPHGGQDSSVTDSNPFFMTASSLGIILSAKDYVKQWATNSELAELNAWHRAAANWLLTGITDDYDGLFRDRQNGDYTPIKGPDKRNIPFFGGPPTTRYGRAYNNRAATIFLYIAMVGIDQDIDTFKRQSKQWYQEYFKFSVYPPAGSYAGESWSGGGFIAELERWASGSGGGPDLGWAYATNTLAIIGSIADHFARAGDTSLYEYETREGLWGTAARPDQPPKSLLYAMTELSKHTDGTIERYGTRSGRHNGDNDYRIDGYNVLNGWENPLDVSYAVTNLYYRDPSLKQAYTRSGPGFRAYRAKGDNGRNIVWQGEWGTYPGVLFQAGQLEGVVAPYTDSP